MERIHVDIAVARLEAAGYKVRRNPETITFTGTLNGQAVGGVFHIDDNAEVAADRLKHLCGK